MEVFAEFLEKIEHPQHRDRTEEVLAWIIQKFPNLRPKIAWNQPMFTDHGTFIIGFSVSKNHLAVGPERAGIIHFSDEIEQAGYEQTKQLFRIPWSSPVPFSLLEKMIAFNILDKANCSTFWRK
ncbi:iron chaperone [Paenibacillus sp. MER 180]|uniref:iron chaperone n=1 Tax=unclassified Paenibacillus TaxID=185978 RepID=UPI000806686A|nr:MULTISPECIES: iron chaperone [unclassified Paenibacillus]MCM3292641.1 iron chaperone [Paenibacillus sp. MER 180]OBY81513.1 iron chaperone [Paenibacillus sp. KS1]